MNLSIISDIAAKLKAHKALACAGLAILLAALGYACFWGYQQYQYRQSSAYAIEQIKAALSPPDPAKLSKYVDFQQVSAELARAVQKSFPFYKAGADQERNIMHILQTSFLKKITSEPAKAVALPTDEEELLKKDLQILPDDFIEQLTKSIHERPNGTDGAYVTAKVENPYLKQAFTLVFDMTRTADGWKIAHLANASELMEQIRAAMLDRFARYRKLFSDKNAATLKRMDELLPVQSCTVDAGLLSDQKTLLMVVHVIARNRGNTQINNFNLDTAISGRGGQVIMRRYLNAAKPVSPGEDFNHRWNFELDAKSQEARMLLRDQPLQCKGIWQTLSLQSGQVLHIVEEPYQDMQCEIAGHDHPQGFCMTPVFLE